jgi:hypothetical protein
MHGCLADASVEVASDFKTNEDPRVTLDGESSQSADITPMFDREPVWPIDPDFL